MLLPQTLTAVVITQ